MSEEKADKTQYKYEMMFIVSPMLAEDKRAKCEKEIEGVIVGRDGKIFDTADWGKRNFSYRIKKHTEGYFKVYYFTVPETSAIKELDEHMRLSPDIVRHMIIRRDEDFEVFTFDVRKKADEIDKMVEQPAAATSAPRKKPVAKPKVEESKDETKVDEPVKSEETNTAELDKKLADIVSDSDIEV